MNTGMHTDVWIYRTLLVLGVIAVVGLASVIASTLVGWPMPNILVALGAVAVAGLTRLLISPLNRELDDLAG